MTNLKGNKEGFTLMELMIVVGLIAVLAGVLTASLANSRKKGNDAAVKANLRTVVNQSEIFYLDNGNSYLPAGGAVLALGACPVYSASGTNMLSRNKVVADSIAEAVKRGTGSSCYNSGNGWAVAVGLNLSPNTSWCVDNTGAGREVNAAPAAAINSITNVCN